MLALFAAVINFGGGFLLGNFLKDTINKRSMTYLGFPVTVKKIYVNPATLVFVIQGLSIQNPAQPSKTPPCTVDSITINVEWIPLFVRKIIIEQCTITHPKIIIDHAIKKPSDRVLAIPFLPYRTKKHRQRHTKYPPMTIENLHITDGHVTYYYKKHSLQLTNVDISVSRFWRSPDRTRMELDFSIETDVASSKGSLFISGTYSRNGDRHSFAGESTAEKIDLSYIYPLYEKYIPFKINRGTIEIKSKPVCIDNTLDMVFHINVNRLSILPLSKNQKVAGIPVSMIQEFLRSTGGSVRTDLHITGTIDNPYFNLNELLSQIIAHKMHEDVSRKINKKAIKAARKITEIIQKSHNKKKK